MNRIVIYDYSPELTSKLKGIEVIPRVHSLVDVTIAWEDARQSNKVFCVWLDAPYMSLSDMDFASIQDGVSLVVYAYNLGDTFNVISQIDAIRRLNIRVFLSSTNEENFGSLKLLSSLGVDCGLQLDAKSIDDDVFLDLASYSLLGQVPHASIEPFDYIWRNIRQERGLDFNTTNFYNPQKYIYINENLDYSFSNEGLKEEVFIGNLEIDKVVAFEQEVLVKQNDYYRHFIELDQCSKCSSFKICNRKCQSLFRNCNDVMAILYEYAEIRDKNEHQFEHKNLCQL